MSIENAIKQKKFRNEFHKLLINLKYTNIWMDSTYSGIFKEHSITHPQYNVLRILRGQYPEPATTNMIIERMMDKSSNASRIIDRLVAKKFVTRVQSSIDRRAVDIMITVAGMELLKTMDPKINGLEDDLTRILSEAKAVEINAFLDKMRGGEE